MFCRLCVFECNKKDTTDVFNNLNDLNLRKLIVKYLLLEISKDDNFSTVICATCLQRIKEFHKFFLHIENRQEVLNEVFLSKVTQNNNGSAFKDNTEVEVVDIDVKTDSNYDDTKNSLDWDKLIDTNDNFKKFDTQSSENVLPGDLRLVDTVDDYDDDESVAESSICNVDDVAFEFCEYNAITNKSTTPDDDEIIKDLNEISQSSSIEVKDAQSRDVAIKSGKTRAQQIKENNEFIEKHAELRCDICGAFLKTFPDFQAHFDNEHNERAYVLCCGLRIKKPWSIVNHIQSHINPIAVSCSLCEKTFSSTVNMKQHIRRFHNENKTQSATVKPTTQKNEENEKNVRNKTQIATVKPITQKKEENEKYIEKHIELKCVLCGLVSDTCQNFRAHSRAKHNRKAFILCCGRKFVKNPAIIEHIETHLNPNTFKCNFCPKILSNKSNLHAHTVRHHGDEENLAHKCEICGKRFSSGHSLKIHMQVHEEGRELFKCEYCDKNFKYESTLKAHRKRNHENFGRSVCHFCGIDFKYKQTFEQHMATKHNVCSKDTMKYCAECKRWFSLHNLRIHEERHKLQDVECNKCGKILPSKMALSKHKRYHPK